MLYHSMTSTNHVLTALVTGSTRCNGIGLGIAKCLAKNHNMNIILHGTRDRATKEVEKCQSDLAKEYNVSVHYIQADLSTSSGAQQLCEQIDGIYPDGIDVLVNNAGDGHQNLVEDVPLQKWESVLTINLTSPFVLIKHFIPAMKKRGWGRIINISSVLGVRAHAKSAVYTSSKHGLNGLTKVVGKEAADTGVTCNAVSPGWVETELYLKTLDKKVKTDGISKEEAKTILMNPTKKYVTPEQIGENVSFLCSRAADNTTCAVLNIDGGCSS
ncbi:D-beta-hydroxybutyrate dehydrogenase-like [Amphiura filiformis]|uniref:D-beta-hydroxybutyrate dehydrogenase-like n=1 Tax=Amphiura filiformis TaxID=82378 RepID=UPI003B2258EC